MFKITKKSVKWGGRDLTIETGKIARQADGAVLVTYGETQVLCTAVGVKENTNAYDFFPLTVHYIEKFFLSIDHRKFLSVHNKFFLDICHYQVEKFLVNRKCLVKKK